MSYTNLRSADPVARKPHPCCWCGEIIVKGEKCRINVGVDNGDFYASRFHHECHVAALEFFGDSSCDPEWSHGMFKRGTTEER